MTQKTDNFDISSKRGMAASIKWLNDYLKQIKSGGIWMVPRSGTVYEVRHDKKEAIKLMSTLPDPSLDIVFRAAGWKVVDNT